MILNIKIKEIVLINILIKISLLESKIIKQFNSNISYNYYKFIMKSSIFRNYQ